jgi:protein-S-isoprenylcysteine O-methyltransferase Ste14
VRHPFYTSFLVSIVAVGLVTANWFIALAGLLPWWLLVLRTRIEEEKLIERFGDEYRRYMERTGRFWPRFRSQSCVD